MRASLFGIAMLVATLAPPCSEAWAQSDGSTIEWNDALDQEPAWYASAEAVRVADNVLLYQHENGGWPQYSPLREGYYERITFNDGAMVGALSVLRDVAAGGPSFAFVAAERRAIVNYSRKYTPH